MSLNNESRKNDLMKTLSLVAIVGMALAINAAASAQQQPKYAADVPDSILTPDLVKTERLGDLNFFDGLPSEETVKKVYDYLDTARGVDAFLNGMPAASIYAFMEGMKEAGMGTYSMGITEGLDRRQNRCCSRQTPPRSIASPRSTSRMVRR